MNQQHRKHNFGMLMLFTIVMFLAMTLHMVLSAVLAYYMISNDILIYSDISVVEM